MSPRGEVGWPRVCLGDVVERHLERYEEPVLRGFERFVKVEHFDLDDLQLQRWGNVNSDTLPPTFKNVFRAGMVLYPTRSPNLRQYAVPDFDGICGEKTLVLKPKDPGSLLPELLPFIVSTDRMYKYANGVAVGSVNAHVRWRDLAAYEFPLPPPAEQRRLAKVLLSLDRLVGELQTLRQKAHVLWRSLSSAEFSKQSDPRSEKLARHYCLPSGQVDPREDEFAVLPLIAPNHIESGTGRLLKLETAREQGAISGKYPFEAGAVLYSKIRPNLVKATIAPTRGLCSADMYPLVPNPSIRKEYLLEILLSDRFTQFAVSGSMRTGIPKLNRKHLAQYECLIPGLPEQDAYLSVALEVKAVDQAIMRRIDDLRVVRSSLMQELSDNGI